jgi:hypothetical protein
MSSTPVSAAAPVTTTGAAPASAPAGLDALLYEHRQAVQHFVGRAAAVAPDRWHVPRGEGKWTPAQESRHIVLTYRALVGDLRGERKMRLKGTPLRRRLWRLVGLTWIRVRRRIIRPVRAPAEVRPDAETASAETLLRELHDAVAEFESVLADTWARSPGRTVTHPYFGELGLRDAVVLCVTHTRHHAAFLPGARRI